MLPLPNFDDPVFDEVRRGPGAKSKGKRKGHASKRAKRGKAAKRPGVGRLKRSRSSR
jgi:hypothetical protein